MLRKIHLVFLFAIVVAIYFVLEQSAPLLLPTAAADRPRRAHLERDSTLAVRKIAFGSCNKHDRSQAYWPYILENKPDLFVWLGDAVYNDQKVLPWWWSPTSPEVMRGKYNAMRQNANYSIFANVTPIIGVWDDHDYGLNDAGADFKYKTESKELFLDFVDEPKSSPRRQREGIYASYTFGKSPKELKVILLDVRSSLTSTEILGEQQWNWLEQELKEPGQVNVIVSPTQVIPRDTFTESWGKVSGEFNRLLNLIRSTRAPGVVLLSGDVHYAQAYQLEGACEPLNYPIFEFCSSGLTHSCGELPFQICYMLKNSLLWSKNQISDMFIEKNFGLLEVDWEREVLKVSFRNLTNSVIYLKEINLTDLQVKATSLEGKIACEPEKSILNLQSYKPTQLAIGGCIVALAVVIIDVILIYTFIKSFFKVGESHKHTHVKNE